ncbi:MAG: hemolysin family protein [Verrucomicrobiota bacterium]
MLLFAAIAVLFFSVVASFFFALAETALFSLGKWQIRQVAKNSPAHGPAVGRLLAQPQELLATILLGNTFANAGMVGTFLWIAFLKEWPLWPTLPGLFLFILLCTEIAPKAFAIRAPEVWALRLARPMSFLQSGFKPFRELAQNLSSFLLRAVPKSFRLQKTGADEEYQELLEFAFQQGALQKSEKEIILEIVRLDHSTVKEVMQPLSKMACIPDDLSVEKMIAAAKQFKHRRLPMYDETPDTIVGVLNTRILLLDPGVDLADAIEFPSFVPESTNLLHLLKSLQRQQRGVAIVLDEFGGTAGIVTMEDILEEIIGEMRGENEAQNFIMERTGPGLWRVNGTMRVEDFRREVPQIGEVEFAETLGGLLVHQLGAVPSAGESAQFRGLKFTAQTVDERRVRELMVEATQKK